ncbi:MAG: hypothetical protein JAY90_15320 [Candidatus Thiodiazotropha lotti]|nr:hypothetical protein [Candidatus Thiodiazotropha lotti]
MGVEISKSESSEFKNTVSITIRSFENGEHSSKFWNATKFDPKEYKVNSAPAVSLKAISSYGIKTSAFYIHHKSYFIEVKIVAMGADPQAEIEKLYQIFTSFIEII